MIDKSELQVRWACLSDAAKIARVGLASAKIEVRVDPLDISLKDFTQIWKDRISTRSHRTVVLCLGERILGYICFTSPLRGGYIQALYIDPEYNRQGLGRILMSVGTEVVKTTGGRTMQVDVQPENYAAHEFYKKTGFVFTGEMAGDLLVMKKEL